MPTFDRKLYWVAREAGRIVGYCRVSPMPVENAGSTLVAIVVRPDRRGRGIGTALLIAVRPALPELGTETVLAAGLKVDRPGHRWVVDSLGFRETHRVVMLTADLPGIDRARWRVPSPAGYRLERWTDHAPEALLASFARARRAIEDMPRVTSGYRDPDWTPERVRSGERDFAAKGSYESIRTMAWAEIPLAELTPRPYSGPGSPSV